MGEAQSDGKLTANKETGEYTLHLQHDAAVADLERVPQRQRRAGPELFYRVLKIGPYNFQVVGARAFLRFADNVDLPSVKPHVRAVRVKS